MRNANTKIKKGVLCLHFAALSVPVCMCVCVCVGVCVSVLCCCFHWWAAAAAADAVAVAALHHQVAAAAAAYLSSAAYCDVSCARQWRTSVAPLYFVRNKIDDKIKMDNGRFSAAAAAATAAGRQNEVARMCRRRVDVLPKRDSKERGGVNSVRREPRARLVRLSLFHCASLRLFSLFVARHCVFALFHIYLTIAYTVCIVLFVVDSAALAGFFFIVGGRGNDWESESGGGRWG